MEPTSKPHGNGAPRRVLVLQTRQRIQRLCGSGVCRLLVPMCSLTRSPPIGTVPQYRLGLLVPLVSLISNGPRARGSCLYKLHYRPALLPARIVGGQEQPHVAAARKSVRQAGYGGCGGGTTGR
jgi:hypothetical protein